MIKLLLNYAEDFRENKIASKVYSALRDRWFDPITVTEHYRVGLGEMDVACLFQDRSAPSDADLEKILSGFIGVTFRLIPLNKTALTK